jgi:replication initiation protein RepC
MPAHTDSEAPCPTPIRAFGCRRVTLEMRVRLDEADHFTGLPHGTAKPMTFLAAFQEAEPYLGLPAHAYKLVSWLMKQTRPQDWEEGSRPIAWPSTQRQAEYLGLSVRATQLLNQALFAAGIFVMRDDPQGRRYGHRDASGRITKAYGFDLSPMALRYDEFVRIAAAAKIERQRMKALRRRVTLARKAITQAAEELAAHEMPGTGKRPGWWRSLVGTAPEPNRLTLLLQEADELVKAARACTCSEDLTVAAKSLERRKDEAEQMVRELVKSVENSPMGEENFTHSTDTTLDDNDSNHTVIASEGSSRVKAGPAPQELSPSQRQSLFPETLHITPAQLVELSPRLAPYMPARFNDMTWPTIIEAAYLLTADLGISSTLWARACQVMGREYAAVAVAIIATRPAGYFTSSPGGYFGGMLKKFEKDPASLCLNKTLWRLKEQSWGKDGHKERREAAKPPRSPLPQAVTVSVGGFMPVGALLQRRQTAAITPSALHSANPAPTSTPRATPPSGKSVWQPSPELLETEERIKAMLRKPVNGPATLPPNDEEKC